MTPVVALVDCNSFYASCEQVFNPALAGRPVVVLSNNDGCVIARSAEAKALGVPMGQPAYQCRAAFTRHGVAVFSSNYALYGDMSARVMTILGEFTPALDVYSIDEAFLDLTGLPEPPEAVARRIRDRVWRWTGLPVSVGLAPTRTLAKLANRAAKKDPALGGVCDLAALDDPDSLLEASPVGAVWGIGRRHAAMLEGMGVLTARQFRDLPRDFVRKRMTVTGLGTQLELRGVPCLDLDDTAPVRKSIMASRSFGKPVVAMEAMGEAVAFHVTRAAERLRAAGLVAGGVSVSLTTNRFNPGEPQYAQSGFRALAAATDHTGRLTRAAWAVLEGIFRPGYRYKKVGVLLSGLEPRGARRLSLFAGTQGDERGERLMATLDAVNARYGRDALRLAATGPENPEWGMKQAARSPRYTTAWDELPVARA